MARQRHPSRWASASVAATVIAVFAGCHEAAPDEEDLLALLRDGELDPWIAAAPATATADFSGRRLVAPDHQGPTVFGDWMFNDCNTQRTELLDSASGGYTAYRSVGVECVPGLSGQAVSIEDVEDLVYVPDQPQFTFEHGVTVAGWVKATELGRTRTIFRKRDKGMSSFALVLNARNRFQFVVNLGDGRAASVTSRQVVQPGVFYHVAGTYDGRTLRLYLDGSEAAGAGAIGAIPPGPGPFLMGNDGSERRFDGVIDNARFEGRALSPDEVLALTCVRLPPTVVITPASATVRPGESAMFDFAVTNLNSPTCAPITLNFQTVSFYPGILDTDPPPRVTVMTPPMASGETAHVVSTAFTYPWSLSRAYTFAHIIFSTEAAQAFHHVAFTELIIEREALPFAFAPPVSYPAPFNAGGLELADVNRDGALDVVVSVWFGFAVLLGNGDGTLGPAVAYSTSSLTADSLTVADLNNDAWLDVVVTGQGGTTLAVFLGNGDGTFGTPTEYSIGSFLAGAAAGDLDRDGNPDLVVSSFLENSVRVLPGNGDGTFGAGPAYATNGNPWAVAVADFFNRSQLEVIASTSDGFVNLFINNGDGTLQPADRAFLGRGSGPALAVGDLDHDGVLDVVRAECCGANSATIMLGTGAGFDRIQSLDSLMSPFGAAIADFNGDGHPDVVLSGEDDEVSGTGPNVSILGGYGTGALERSVQYTSGWASRDVAAGDLNGDGRPDFVVAANQSETETVWVFLNTF